MEKVIKKKLLVNRPLKLSAQFEKNLNEICEIIISPGHSENDIISCVQDVHGLITHAPVTARIIQSAPHLQLIATPLVGYDKIDVAAASRANVAVIANTGVSAGTVAEFTLGLMIALARRIVWADYDVRKKRDWSGRETFVNPALEMGNDLHGAMIGIVGFGSIGVEVAKLCRAAFSARVAAYDPFVSRERMAALGVEKYDNLLDLAKEVDFLNLHLALTDETRYLINETIIRAMKPGAFLINCARGAIVEEKALVKALKNRWIAGAAIDVTEEEPINADNPLLDIRNVIITPHIAGITRQSSAQRSDEIIKRVLDFFTGKKPAGLINPEVWPQTGENSGF
jgi:D-3-phosphoglycerate dehydrogenase